MKGAGLCRRRILIRIVKYSYKIPPPYQERGQVEPPRPALQHRCGRPPQGRARVPTLQGLTLVHFSAQLERFVWDRGCT